MWGDDGHKLLDQESNIVDQIDTMGKMIFEEGSQVSTNLSIFTLSNFTLKAVSNKNDVAF